MPPAKSKPKQLTILNEEAKKSNELCRARLDCASSFSNKVAMMLTGMLYKDRGQVQEYEISPNLLADYNLSSSDFKGMCESVKELTRSAVFLWNDEEMDFIGIPIFRRVIYSAKTKKITVKLNRDLIKHYVLKDHFAMFDVLDYIRLTSMYTQKLFEFLMSWRFNKDGEAFINVDIDRLHDILNTPEKTRSNFAEFNRTILNPAYLQIHKETNLRYEYIPHRRPTESKGRGGKITFIQFIFDLGYIKKMATPQYRFTTLSMTTQKAIHREFVKSFAYEPKFAVQWLKDPESDTYKGTFSYFLKTHPKCQPPPKRQPRKRKTTTKTEESL